MYFYLFARLLCVLCFLDMSENLTGSGRVWQLIVVLLGAKWGCLVLKGLEWDMSFCVFLLDLLCSLELLEDFLAYKPFCYCMYAFVYKKHSSNIICTCISK